MVKWAAVRDARSEGRRTRNFMIVDGLESTRGRERLLERLWRKNSVLWLNIKSRVVTLLSCGGKGLSADDVLNDQSF